MFRISSIILCSQTTFSRLRSVRCSESLLCCPPAVWVPVLIHSDWSTKKSQPTLLKVILQEKRKTNPQNYWNILFIEDVKIRAEYALKWYIWTIRNFQNHFLLHQDYLAKFSQGWEKIDGWLDLTLQGSQEMTRCTSGPEMKLGCIFESSNRHSLNHLT